MIARAFTPGPWEVVRSSSGGGLLTILVRGPHGPKKHIAETCWGADVADKETGARGIDDANLIAAAPELFEACDAAFDFLGGVDDAAEIRATLLAAVLKARGEAR